MRSLLLIWLLLLSRTPVFGQYAPISQVDNPLMPNALALQKKAALLVNASVQFQHLPLLEPTTKYDDSGALLGRGLGFGNIGPLIRLRYALLNGLEVQLGYMQQTSLEIFENTNGENSLSRYSTYSHYSLGARYGHYFREGGIHLGVQATFVGEPTLIPLGFFANGIMVDLLFAKELGTHHLLTGRIGVNTIWQDFLPLSLSYCFKPNEQFGFYNMVSYSLMINAIGISHQYHQFKCGVGAYYQPSYNWRIDVSTQYRPLFTPNVLYSHSLQFNLGIALDMRAIMRDYISRPLRKRRIRKGTH